MKVVIFAGGRGTRIAEESSVRPKPMIKVGGEPLLFHIMKIYANYGFDDFVICSGYKGEQIMEYANSIRDKFSYKINVVDTGIETMTAGRLKRISKFIDTDNFMLTYGDGVADIPIDELINYHKQKGKICTMTIVQPQSRFGIIDVDDDGLVNDFTEKPKEDGTWINGGFFVLNKSIFNYLSEDVDQIMWEAEPLNALVRNKELVAYKHRGFWKCLDTPRDKDELEKLWQLNQSWKNVNV